MSVIAEKVYAKHFVCDATACSSRSIEALSQEEAARIASRSGWRIDTGHDPKDYCPKHAHLATRPR